MIAYIMYKAFHQWMYDEKIKVINMKMDKLDVTSKATFNMTEYAHLLKSAHETLIRLVSTHTGIWKDFHLVNTHPDGFKYYNNDLNTYLIIKK